MESPNQHKAVKTFLNVTTFKPLDGNKEIGVPVNTTIDITDKMEEYKVPGLTWVNGISDCDLDEKGEYGDTPTRTFFVISESRISFLVDGILDIVDASIVNAKQANAVKKLIKEKEFDFIQKLWHPISQ